MKQIFEEPHEKSHEKFFKYKGGHVPALAQTSDSGMLLYGTRGISPLRQIEFMTNAQCRSVVGVVLIGFIVVFL